MGDPNIEGYEYIVLILIFIGTCLTTRMQYSIRHNPRDIFDKEVPKNSIWRKLYPFKEKKNKPLIYCKLVPFIITWIIFIVVLMIYVIYWIFPELLRPFLVSKGVVISAMCYPLVITIYMMIILD